MKSLMINGEMNIAGINRDSHQFLNALTRHSTVNHEAKTNHAVTSIAVLVFADLVISTSHLGSDAGQTE